MGKADLRREWIFRMLKEKGAITVNEIVNQYSCSEVTVRRDLEVLESEKKLIRTFGGAILEEERAEIPFYRKLELHLKEKNEIAAKVFGMIQDGDIIGLTGGSTTYYIAKKIRESNKKVTIVTNAINIAYEMVGIEGIQIVVIGGVVRSQSFELYGPMSDVALSNIIITKMFVGADGISLSRGIMTYNEFEAHTNRLMLERAIEKYVVIDHSKFSIPSLFLIDEIKALDGIITDSGIAESVMKQYQEAGYQII